MKRICLDDPEDFLDHREGSGGSVEIFDIQVMSSRREGKGRLLVDRLIKSLPKSVLRIWAITRAENYVAQEFYEELNFRACPLRDFYGVKDENGSRSVDAILYIRDLTRNP
jgi:ribosomal protein S18 acetylase RimI-like enzyme